MDSDFEANAGFGGALDEDGFDLGVGCEERHDGCGRVGGHDEVDVANDFFAAPIASCDFDLDDFVEIAELFAEVFGEWGDLVEAEGVGVAFSGFEGFEEVGGRFCAESFQGGDGAVFRGGFEGFEGGDVELFPEDFDFFWAEALEFEEVEQTFGNGFFEFVEVREGACGDEGGDFVGECVAHSWEAGEGSGGDEFFEVAGEGFEGSGTVCVGADFENGFAFEFEDLGDVFEERDGFVSVFEEGRHGWRGCEWDWL